MIKIIESQITCVRNLLHGKLSIGKEGEGSPRRETDEGDKSIPGQRQYFFNVDSLLLPDGAITTDPIQMHDRLTEAFAGRFICP